MSVLPAEPMPGWAVPHDSSHTVPATDSAGLPAVFLGHIQRVPIPALQNNHTGSLPGYSQPLEYDGSTQYN
ncbi:hypothetical protein BASA62_003299 [Batrachochytrium salamandrivorans]|nr:hypothetical protein BASA62_003299 [Batrachochytrium salamandrivorans]